MSRSELSQIHFVPVGQYYGILEGRDKWIGPDNGGYLLEDN